MSQNLLTFFILLAFLLPVIPASASDPGNFLHDEFDTLDHWKPLLFPKIEKHSVYSIVKEGDSSYLKAESKASASGMVFRKEFNVFEYPKVKWAWKASNVYKKGNAEEKTGDDYPVRVYIFFKYEPEKASFSRKVKYGIAKRLYGEYPPHSSLNYIWANRKHNRRVIPSAFASDSMMIPLQAGTERIGDWVKEDIDILRDYRKIFGTDPPPITSIAIMNDSDNTGESSVSFFDYIEVYR
jgi:hypothetical protein